LEVFEGTGGLWISAGVPFNPVSFALYRAANQMVIHSSFKLEPNAMVVQGPFDAELQIPSDQPGLSNRKGVRTDGNQPLDFLKPLIEDEPIRLIAHIPFPNP
jgi:hypothetical protein